MISTIESSASAVRYFESLAGKMSSLMLEQEASDAVASMRDEWREGRRGRKSEAGRDQIAIINEAAIHRIKSGESVKSVARHLGIHPDALQSRLNKLGVSIHKLTKEHRNEQTNRAMQMVIEGAKMKEAALAIGLNENALRQRFNAIGFNVKKAKQLRKQSNEI